MKATDFAARFLISIGVFFAAIIIVSNIIGFFWLNSFFIGAASAVLAYFLVRRFEPKPEAGKGVFVLLALLLILLAYPVMLMTSFHASGTDAISTTMLRILDGRIPFTHEPYSGINLSYALGSPLVNNLFSEVLFVVPDYLWPWIMGLVCGVLQLFFFYLFSRELLGDKKAALYAAAVFFCGKLIFENFYVGEFAWYLGSAFMVLFLYLHLKKNPLQYIIFPVTFAAHPLAGFNLLLIMGTKWLVHRPKISEVAKLAASLALVAPLLAMAYLPIAANLLFGKKGVFGLALDSVLPNLSIVPFWVGTGLTLVFVVLLIVAARKGTLLGFKEKRFVWGLFFVSMGAFVLFSALGFMLAGRVLEITIMSMTLLSAAFIAQLKLGDKKRLIAFAMIFIVFLAFFLTSSKLNHYREGSKISMEGVGFAEIFYSIDPERSSVLFLTNEGGKIAEYANKLPYDVTQSHTIVSFDFVYYQDAAFYEMKEKKAIQKSILFDKNISMIQGLDVKYIVAKASDFNIGLPYKTILEHGDYKVYIK